MLVTFGTNAFANVVMFGDVAKELLRLMGRNDTIPSAILPEDIPKALSQLIMALESEAEPVTPHDDDDRSVSLKNRALPLIQLLEAAVKDDVPVTWET